MQNLGAIRFTKGGEHDQVPRIGLHPGTVVHMLRTLLHGRIWVLVNPHPRRCHMQDVSIMPVYHSSSVPWPHPRVPWSTPTPRVPLIAMNGPLAPCQGSIVVSHAAMPPSDWSNRWPCQIIIPSIFCFCLHCHSTPRYTYRLSGFLF